MMKSKEAVTGLVPSKGVKGRWAEDESNMCTRWKKVTWVCAGKVGYRMRRECDVWVSQRQWDWGQKGQGRGLYMMVLLHAGTLECGGADLDYCKEGQGTRDCL